MHKILVFGMTENPGRSGKFSVQLHIGNESGGISI